MQAKRSTQGGFTLIELIVTVAIIGILSAIAIPAYQNYVARSSVAAALAEATGGKIGFEDNLNRGKVSDTPASIGLSPSHCTAIRVTTGTSGSIACDFRLKGEDKALTLSRDATTNQWSCTTTADADFAPAVCATAKK